MISKVYVFVRLTLILPNGFEKLLSREFVLHRGSVAVGLLSFPLRLLSENILTKVLSKADSQNLEKFIIFQLNFSFNLKPRKRRQQKNRKKSFTWKKRHKIMTVEMKIKFSSNSSSPTVMQPFS